MTSAASYVEELLGLVLEFKRQLDLRKRRDNLIDFHDMEHFALEILLKKRRTGRSMLLRQPKSTDSILRRF